MPTEVPANSLPAPVVPLIGLLDTAGFDAKRRQQVGIIAASATMDAQFGAGPQRKLAGFIDQLGSSNRADEIGIAGQLAAELAATVRGLDLAAAAREAAAGSSVLARLLLLGRRVSPLQRLRTAHPSAAERLADAEHRLGSFRDKLAGSGAVLARVLAAAEATLREMEVWIAGGQQALLRWRAEQASSADGSDPAQLAERQAAAARIDVALTRLARLEACHAEGRRLLPAFRAGLEAGRAEMTAMLEALLAGLPGLRDAVTGLVSAGAGLPDPVPLLATADSLHRLGREAQAGREAVAVQLGALRTTLLTGLGNHPAPAPWG